MENVRNISPAPGDVVREERDGLDYIVYTVAATGTGLLALSGISIADQSVKKWMIQNYTEDELNLIRSNYLNEDPDLVARRIVSKYQQAVRIAPLFSQTDFAAKLMGPEGTFVRDMLLIGDNIENYNSSLIKLAKSLNGLSPLHFKAEDIYEIIKDATPPEAFSEEFVRTFATNFVTEIEKNKKPSTGGYIPVAPKTTLANLLLPQQIQKHTAEGTVTSTQRLVDFLIQSFNSAPEQMDIDPRVGRFIQGHSGMRDALKYYGGTLSDSKGSQIGLQRHNASILLDILARETGFNSDPTTINLVARDFLNEALTTKNQRRISQILSNPIIKAKLDMLEGKRTPFLQRKRKQRQAARENLGSRLHAGRSKLTLNQLDDMILSGKTDFISIDKQTLLENYLRGGVIKFGDQKLNVENGIDYQLAKEALAENPHTNLLMRASDVRRMVAGQEIDLGDVLDVDSRLHKMLRDVDIFSIGQTHMSANMLNTRSNPTVAFSLHDPNDAAKITLPDALNNSQAYSQIESSLPSSNPTKQRMYFAISDTSSDYFVSDSLQKLDQQITESGTLSGNVKFTYGDFDDVTAIDPRYITATQTIFDTQATKEAIDKGVTFRNLGNYIKQRVGIARSAQINNLLPVRGDDTTLFMESYVSTKIALAGYKGVDGTDVTRTIGSGIGVKFEKILQRADKLLSPDQLVLEFQDIATEARNPNNVYLLDIEPSPKGGFSEYSIVSASRAEEISRSIESHRREGKLNSKINARNAVAPYAKGQEFVRGNNTLPKRKQQILNMLDELEKAEVVITQSANDYTFMSSEIDFLVSKGQLTPEEGTNLKRRVNDVKLNKGLTSETVSQLTGVGSLGNSAQSRLLGKQLNRQQTHTALVDNLDNLDILNSQKEVYQKIRSTVNFAGLEGQQFVINTSRVRYMQGQTIIVKSARTLLDGTIQLEYQKESGIIDVFTGSVDEIGAFLGVDAHSLKHGSDAVQQIRKTAIEDYAGRMARNLNPFTIVGEMSEARLSVLNTLHTDAGAFNLQLMLAAKLLKDQGKLDYLNKEGVTGVELHEQIKNIFNPKSAHHVDYVDALLDSLGLSTTTLTQSHREEVLGSLGEMLTNMESNSVFSEAVDHYIGSFKGDNFKKIINVLKNSETKPLFQTIMADILHEAKENLIETDYFRFSINPHIGDGNKIRASKSFLVGEPTVNTLSTIDSFFNELVQYAARSDQDDYYSSAARKMLGSAGVNVTDHENTLFKILQQNPKEFFKSTVGAGLFHDLVDMGEQGAASELRVVSDKFFKNYKGLDDLMTARYHEMLSFTKNEHESNILYNIINRTKNTVSDLQQTYKQEHGRFTELLAERMNAIINEVMSENPEVLKDRFMKKDFLGALGNSNVVDSAIERAMLLQNANPEQVNRLITLFNEDELILDESGNPLLDEKGNPTGATRKRTLENFVRDYREIVSEIQTESVHVDPTTDVPTNFTEGPDMLEAFKRQATKIPQGASDNIDQEVIGRATLDYTLPSGTGAKSFMVVAGAIALLGAFRPNLDGGSAGQRSEQVDSFNSVNRVAEIPGSSRDTKVFMGQTSPFQLDISIKAFSQKREELAELVTQVENTINSNVEVLNRKLHRHNEDEKVPTIEHLRRAL